MPKPRHDGQKTRLWGLFHILATVCLLSGLAAQPCLAQTRTSAYNQEGVNCYPRLPNVLAYDPPKSTDSGFQSTASAVDEYLQNLASQNDTDSVVVAIVTSEGPLYEKGFGIARANETNPDAQIPPNRDSIYRIASVSKLFTVLETLILRQKGALTWDDPVRKWIPNFSSSGEGWINFLEGRREAVPTPRITVHQLASHLSGLSRALPSEVQQWPRKQVPNDDGNSTQSPDAAQTSFNNSLNFVSEYPLVTRPSTFTVYSNIAFTLLGMVNVIANNQSNNSTAQAPKTHKELLKCDVFDPLGLESSFFDNPTPEQYSRIVIPANNSQWADYDFSDADDATGGQFSSVADLGRVLTSFLSPTGNGSVLTPATIDEWLMPLDSWTTRRPGSSSPWTIEQVGAPWEIRFADDRQSVYTKGGDLPGYYANMALIPDLSLGIAVLRTGEKSDTANIVLRIFSIIRQFFLDKRRALLYQAYTGTWVQGEDVAEVQILPRSEPEVLVMTKLVVAGVDVLALGSDFSTGGLETSPASDTPHQVALWYTGHVGEFRFAFGEAGQGSAEHPSCIQYWMRVDYGLWSKGAPIDLIYWSGGRLVYPSAGVTFERN